MFRVKNQNETKNFNIKLNDQIKMPALGIPLTIGLNLNRVLWQYLTFYIKINHVTSLSSNKIVEAKFKLRAV